MWISAGASWKLRGSSTADPMRTRLSCENQRTSTHERAFSGALEFKLPELASKITAYVAIATDSAPSATITLSAYDAAGNMLDRISTSGVGVAGWKTNALVVQTPLR